MELAELLVVIVCGKNDNHGYWLLFYYMSGIVWCSKGNILSFFYYIVNKVEFRSLIILMVTDE